MNDELTASDLAKIEAEIEERKLVLRPKLIEAVKEARAQGDLSENFEYYAAKREKNRNESRIRYLERMVRTAVVISDDSKADEVGLNNTVTVLFEEENETETYRIVTTVREDSLNRSALIMRTMYKSKRSRRRRMTATTESVDFRGRHRRQGSNICMAEEDILQ